MPSVHDIQTAGEGLQVRPVPNGSPDGDHGACEEGFVWLWRTSQDGDVPECGNIVLWFDRKGEFWTIHGTAIADWKQDKQQLEVGQLIRGWRKNLQAAMRVLDHFGAHPARKVEAGVVGIKGVMWPTNFVLESSPARKNQTILQRQQRDWSDAAQLEFLTDVYNKIRNNFALPHEDQTALKKITGDK